MTERFWFKSLEIEAFGHFHQFKLNLRPGLNVLWGPNEAGKSTLFAFIRAVLFGFENKGSAARYEPKSGGSALGGALRLATERGEYVVRRTASAKRSSGELTVLNGVMAPVPEIKLADLLGGISRELFSTVYSFDLDGLRSFEALLEHSPVSDALFAATLEGGPRLPGALKRLDETAQALYAPKSGGRPINALLPRLDHLRQRLRDLGDRPKAYFDARSRLEALQNELQAVEQEHSAAQVERHRMERIREVFEAIEEAKRLELLLAQLPADESVPFSEVPRLDEWEKRLEALGGEGFSAEEQLKLWHARREGLCEGLDERRAAVGQLETALSRFKLNATQASSLHARAEALERQRENAERSLEQLGLPKATLEKLPTGQAPRAELAGFRERLTRGWEERAQAQQANDDAVLASREAQARCEQLEKELSLGPSHEVGQVDQALDAAGSLSTVGQQIQWAQAQLQQRRGDLAQWNAAAPRAPKRARGAWVIGLLGFLLALEATVVGSPKLAAAGAAALVFSLAVLAAKRLRQNRWRAESAAHGERAQLFEKSVAQLTGELSALEQQQQRLFRAVGIEHLAQLGQRREALRVLKSQAERRNSLVQERELAFEALARAQRLANHAQGRAEEKTLETSLASEQLGLKLVQWGLSASLGIHGAIDVLAQATALKERFSAVEAELRAVRAELDEAQVREETLRESARALGIDGDDGLLVRACERWLAETQSRATEVEALERQSADGEARLSALHRERAALTEKCRALWQQASVESSDAFRSKAAQAQQRQSLLSSLQQKLAHIEASTGLNFETAWQEACAEVPLDARLQTATERCQRLQQRSSQLSEERGALTHQLGTWESDAAMAQLRQEEESLCATLSQTVQRYVTARFAHRLIQREKERFEAEHQPALVRRAQESFGKLTDGRYPTLYYSAPDRRLEVRDVQGRSFEIDQLSRGTREALFIALRLAVVRHLGEERARLPVLVDDAMVNFDGVRLARMAEALGQLATEHQVVVLTCQKWVHDALSAQRPHWVEVTARPQLSLLPQ